MKRAGFNPLEGGVRKPSPRFEDLYPRVRRAARARLRTAVAMGAASPQDCEDLEQEALLAVWRVLQRFDPSRASLGTFVERVVAARFASVMRARRCQPTFEPVEEHFAGLDGIPAVEFRMDFQRVCASLAGPDRRLAAVLKDRSPSEASRALGISRSTVYERIRRIRGQFENAGLGPRAGCGR